jgi:hypothetical protein
MSTIVIQADAKSSKLLSELAKKLGGKVLSLKDEQYEDFVFGTFMDNVKTNETVSREIIMKQLSSK